MSVSSSVISKVEKSRWMIDTLDIIAGKKSIPPSPLPRSSKVFVPNVFGVRNVRAHIFVCSIKRTRGTHVCNSRGTRVVYLSRARAHCGNRTSRNFLQSRKPPLDSLAWNVRVESGEHDVVFTGGRKSRRAGGP